MTSAKDLTGGAGPSGAGLLSLRSDALEIIVDPLHGGNIRSLKRPGSIQDWISFDSSRRPSGGTGMEPYDDVWCGGFEELFPNDAPCRFEGRDLPDHGELWSSPLQIVALGADHIALRLRCRSVPAMFEKWIQLTHGVPEVRIRYRITNHGLGALRFLFKLHPAVSLEPGDRILLAGGTVVPVDPAFGTRCGQGRARWPRVLDKDGAPFDLSRVLPRDSGSREFVYVSDLPEGWCGLERTGTGEQITFTYSIEDFPYCWLFLTYGGWRGYYAAVLEPCTNMPKDLDDAAATGRCAMLESGASRSYDVRVRLKAADG